MTCFLDRLTVSPLADGYTWYLVQQFRYAQQAPANNTIAVPDRFETDFASIPFPLDILLPKWSDYGPAAVVHDWLYWDQPVQLGRAGADGVLLEAMRTLRVAGWKRALIYLGVRAFGWWPWWENARAKRRGVSRLQPPGAGWPAMPSWRRFRFRSPGSWKPGTATPTGPSSPA